MFSNREITTCQALARLWSPISHKRMAPVRHFQPFRTEAAVTWPWRSAATQLFTFSGSCAEAAVEQKWWEDVHVESFQTLERVKKEKMSLDFNKEGYREPLNTCFFFWQQHQHLESKRAWSASPLQEQDGDMLILDVFKYMIFFVPVTPADSHGLTDSVLWQLNCTLNSERK